VSEATPAAEAVIVRKGQSITRLAEKHYGMSNITLADCIMEFNPEITNAHHIAINQKIRMPKITEGSLIVPSSDRTYKINVGTFWSPEFARLYRAEPSLKEKTSRLSPEKRPPGRRGIALLSGISAAWARF